MAEGKIPTVTGTVVHVGLGLAGIRFETVYGPDTRTAWASTPGREMITHLGQIVEIELGGQYGSISRVLSVREPEEEVGDELA